MTRDGIFLAALADRFGSHARIEGDPELPVVCFAARHPEVGDARVSVPGPSNNMTATIEVGTVLHDLFHDYDTHRPVDERLEHLTRDVLRFLTHLFDDRLLFWTSVEHGRGGWRERLEAPHTDPLVLDNCLYRTYLWSGPLALWRASDQALGRGYVASEREYELLETALDSGAACGIDDADRGELEQLLRDYEAAQPEQG